MMKMNITRLALAGFLTTGLLVQAQEDDEDEIFELSPFAVDASDDVCYRSTTTLAGSRGTFDLGRTIIEDRLAIRTTPRRRGFRQLRSSSGTIRSSHDS